MWKSNLRHNEACDFCEQAVEATFPIPEWVKRGCWTRVQKLISEGKLKVEVK